MKQGFNLIIAGDFFFKKEFLQENLISDEIIKIFKLANFRVLNFEAPIVKVDTITPILKTGPNLSMKKEVTIPVLKKLNIDLVTLSNNHIMDFGSDGLRNTFEELNKNDIKFTGAGLTLEEAKRPYIILQQDIKISILNFAENEWSISKDKQPGANPLDIIENVKQIKNAKTENDIVIVIIHGGHEYYELPSPKIVKQYRFYAENGADIIVAHHSHCYSGFEIHKGVPIFYSLGNFLFTLDSKNDLWYTGLLLKLTISKNRIESWAIIPIQQERATFFLSPLIDQEKNDVLEKVKKLSLIISDEYELIKNWNQFIRAKSRSCLQTFSPSNIFGNRYINAGLRLLNIDRLFRTKRQYRQILNTIRCESHLEISKNCIEDYLKND